MASAPQAAYEFGRFTLLPTEKRLLSDREVVPLAPKVFDTLVLLVENQGRLVQKDELLKALWPNSVVEEQALAHNISQLRKVLRDPAEDPKFIETVPKRGYRFIASVRTLSEPLPVLASPALSSAVPSAGGRLRLPRWRVPAVLAVVLVLTAGTTAYVYFPRTRPEAARALPAIHSLAVLPFVNISGDKQQEYFSDGLTEELLNSLSRINELQVAARTSSFYFKGKDVDLPTIAQRLNVASVLEGSVRRSGNKVRITAQLTNAVTGFHLWSQTYDRDLSDVLQIQTDIANAVANALKITLLDDVAAKIELGGTRNSEAFDAYLRGSKALYSGQGVSSQQNAIAAYTEAIRLDATFALAFAGRSQALSGYAWEFATGTAIPEFWDKSQADARQALNLAPGLAEGYLALASNFQRGSHDFAQASEAFERAMALAPGNAVILGEGGRFAAQIGQFDAGVAAARRAVALDPLSAQSRALLGEALYWARRFGDAVSAYGEAVSLEPDYEAAYGFRGLADYGLRDFQSARSSCETKRSYWISQRCLAVTYDKLGRHADAEAELKKLQAAYGNAAAYSYSTIYAQWGNKAKALEWLATALQEPCGCLVYVRTDPLLDPLRGEPRFQAVMRELKFPQ